MIRQDWMCVLFALFGALLFFCRPLPLDSLSYSVVVENKEGELLSAQVADDGQWRFPLPDSVPERVATALRLYEDEYFYSHPGINPVAVVRAIRQNLEAGAVVSGASTLSMQLARMLLRRPRTWQSKGLELLLTIRLEQRWSKNKILKHYLALAPFGGNVVGLEAAAWRYYAKSPHALSWSEAATLAVLPNNPGMIFPGRGDDELMTKRNRLLEKMMSRGYLDSMTYELALIEPLPGAPFDLPRKAPHLLTTFSKSSTNKRLTSTLSPKWQTLSAQLLKRHHSDLSANGVENLAVLVVDLATGGVLAYQGNTQDVRADGHQVDILQSRRSPGSTLKPFLFASSLHKGLIQRRTLIPDVPSFFGGFSPKNFNRGYNGMVPANQTLSRSLNIGFCHLLREYTYQQFHYDLQEWGLTTLDQPADHYGLSLILGGCEVTPWELTQLYFSYYRKLASLPNIAIHFDGQMEKRPSIDVDRDAIWQTFQSMTALARPDEFRHWRNFSSSQLIAWKTGTSFGFRDAWAVGINGSKLVTVWAGNADGEGRAELTGIKAAAPLMLQLINRSAYDGNWLENLKPGMVRTAMCKQSGYLPNPHCPTVTQEITQRAEKIGTCPFHKQLTMDQTGTFEVHSGCYPLSESIKQTHFVLPAISGHYYKQVRPDYQGRPPRYDGCVGTSSPVEIIYPNPNSRVFIPVELDGNRGEVVLQAAHEKPNEPLFWHVDQAYLGATQTDHQLSVSLPKGRHELLVMDGSGQSRAVTFFVVDD